jgi:hypothetical protein
MNTHHRFYTVQCVWILLCTVTCLVAEPKNAETLRAHPPETVELNADEMKAKESVRFYVALENVSHKRLFLSDQAGSAKITWKNPPPRWKASPGGYSVMGRARRFELVEAVDLPLERQGENFASVAYEFEPQKWTPHEADAIEGYQIEITLVAYEVGAKTPTDYTVSFPL